MHLLACMGCALWRREAAPARFDRGPPSGSYCRICDDGALTADSSTGQTQGTAVASPVPVKGERLANWMLWAAAALPWFDHWVAPADRERTPLVHLHVDAYPAV